MAFMTGTFVLYRQVRFMKNYDLGMNMDQVIAVKGYGFQSYKTYENFKTRLTTSPVITSIGSSSAAPSDEINLQGLVYKLRAGENPETAEIKMVNVDADFFKTLEVEFIAGRNFDQESKTDGQAVILNETAAQALGFDEMNKIIHQPLHNLKAKPSEIIGVIKNYNQLSLKNPYEPIVFIPNWIRENDLGWNSFYFFIRINPAHQQDRIAQAVTEMEKAWKAVVPEHPFNYFFLDNYFDRQYKSDTTFSSLFLFFSLFAIFITCIGLFGLVAYTTLQRTKEIGIRKVLGASVENILVLLSKDLVVLMCIAATIATPFIVVGLQHWLETYAFRINLSTWIFALPLLVIFLLAYATVIFKSLKVATANPIESIRYE
jgi:putative ABC transport system permease protein